MIQVYVRDSDYSTGKNVWIVNKTGDKTLVAKPFVIKFEEGDSCGCVEPTMRLSGELGEEFLKAFAEALDRSDIKTDNDFKIKGLLEAKDAHLQDMRRLVFKEE